jgi:hypothetical protein
VIAVPTFLTQFPATTSVYYSVAEPEPEPQGAASFGRSRSRNAMRLRLRRLRFRQRDLTWLGIKKRHKIKQFLTHSVHILAI